MNMKFWVVVLFGLSAMTSGIAQSNKRDVLLDSMVNVVLDGIQRADIIEMNNTLMRESKGAGEEKVRVDPMKCEIVFLDLLKKMAFPYITNCYQNLTDEELAEVIGFMSSEAYLRFSSIDFKNKIHSMLESEWEELKTDMSEGFTWKSKYKKPKDPEYNALADKVIKNGGVQNMLNDIKNSIDLSFWFKSRGISRSSMVQNILSDVRYEVGEAAHLYYKNILLDYISKEHLEVLADFYESSAGMKMEVSGSHTEMLKGILSYAMSSNAPVAANDYIIRDEGYLFSYVNSIKDRPLVKKTDCKFRPVMSLKTKRGQYVGETRNGLPHGKGALTDKKGNVYTGYFKEGMRHGRIATYLLNGDSIVEVWAEDKVMKVQNRDSLMSPILHDGRRMGFGGYAGVECGWYIDGTLNGDGIRTNHGVMEEGYFEGGKLVRGRVSSLYPNGNMAVFEGEIDGNVKCGKMIVKSSNNGAPYNMIMNGCFVDNELHGAGSVDYVSNGFMRHMEGFFGYGKLYGDGTLNIKRDANNYRETYIGEFFAGKYNGKGSRQLMYVGADSIGCFEQMEGGFDDGELNGDFTLTKRMTKVLGQGVESKVIGMYGMPCVVCQDTLTVNVKGVAVNGILHGKGEVSISNGDFYNGDFKDDRFVKGTVRMTYDDGSYYEGNYNNGQRNGVIKNKRGTVIRKINR